MAFVGRKGGDVGVYRLQRERAGLSDEAVRMVREANGLYGRNTFIG